MFVDILLWLWFMCVCLIWRVRARERGEILLFVTCCCWRRILLHIPGNCVSELEWLGDRLTFFYLVLSHLKNVSFACLLCDDFFCEKPFSFFFVEEVKRGGTCCFCTEMIVCQ